MSGGRCDGGGLGLGASGGGACSSNDAEPPSADTVRVEVVPRRAWDSNVIRNWLVSTVRIC